MSGGGNLDVHGEEAISIAQMKKNTGAAVHQHAVTREESGYHFRAISGTAYVLAAVIGTLFGQFAGLRILPEWQGVFAVAGLIAMPILLWKLNQRQSKRYARLDAEAQLKQQEEMRLYREKQIAEAQARGDFDRWTKSE